MSASSERETTQRAESMQTTSNRAGARVSVRYGRRVFADGVTLIEALELAAADLPQGALAVSADNEILARLEVFHVGGGDSYRGWLIEIDREIARRAAEETGK